MTGNTSLEIVLYHCEIRFFIWQELYFTSVIYCINHCHCF